MQNQEQLLDWIQLINSGNIGPVTFYKLIDFYQSAEAALEALPKLKKYKLCSRDFAKRELDKAYAKGIRILTKLDNAYPENLQHIEDAPPVLYVWGNAALLNAPLSLSVVGARNASINGRKTASHLAYDLTNNGVLIISGMARGIDSAAHKGAMYAKKQCGETIAVLGTGVDVIYPAENAKLYDQIKEQGAVISEFPLGTEAQSSNFPRRNRIVRLFLSEHLWWKRLSTPVLLLLPVWQQSKGKMFLPSPVLHKMLALSDQINSLKTALFWLKIVMIF